ncbi:cullin-2-like isoform X2 [Pecten maximus]|uniref:cullin-2-like isoform X2 n=1 Tax=Pecten maximus TaxID=6579 RepID=UPI001458B67E|nr:cullin-2-like isoform X2 [Pecten maximus]
MSLRPRRVDFDTTWVNLLETVKGVITCAQVPRATWNDRFSDVYALCVACPEPLGDRLYQETKNFLEAHVETLHKNVVDGGEKNFLSLYHTHWVQYSKGSSFLNQLYGYLNTTYIKKQKYSDADLSYGGFSIESSDQMLEIGELALDTWKRLMVEPLKDALVRLILIDVWQDRCNGTVNQTILHGVINSFVNVEDYKKKHPLQLYEDIFEKPFRKETGDYYRQEAAKLKDECNCSEYMEKVIFRLDNEDFRSRKFLHPSSYNKITFECQQRMVADHLQFLHGECKEMVKLKHTKDLSNMYRLLKPINGGLGVLIQEVESHIRRTGLEAVKNLKGENIPAQFVESMLEVHKHYTELIQQTFQTDQQFVGALDKACAAAINYRHNPKHPCKSAELLAKYCDNLLKKSSKGISEMELDDKLSSCITVFKYLDDKDVFQRFYSRMLAKRLIFSQSASMDAEEAMINKLKQACGYEFTNKLHRMFTDMSISMGLNNDFSDFIRNKDNEDLGVNFTIMVLQAGAWPIGQSNLPTFAIPQELERSVRMFETFYNGKFSGRKLTWMHNFCSAELKFNYLKRPFIVTMGTFHMAMLLLYNTCDRLTFTELMDNTKLPEKELVKQIQGLIDTKLVIVTGDKDDLCRCSFDLNMEYTNKRTKFKIASTGQRESPQEVESTHNAVDEDRKMYLQAAIVRIMKARKILKHTMLIQEVISQARARFTPNIPMIKKCIEALIDKQYLERTPNSSDEYRYVA